MKETSDETSNTEGVLRNERTDLDDRVAPFLSSTTGSTTEPALKIASYPNEKPVTIPFERTRALIHAYELLKRLQDPKATPRVPRWLRGRAKALVKHYPSYADLEQAHKALPDLFGPVPPFSRLTGTPDAQSVVNATKGKQ